MARSQNTKVAIQYEKEAKKWNRKKLLEIWTIIQSGKPLDGWEAGKGFEYLIVRAFEIEGAEVGWPYAVTYPQRFGTME